MTTTVVELTDLSIELESTHAKVVTEVSLHIGEGEILGLVGESGSGKTTVSTALLGYCRRGARLSGGEVRIDGRSLSTVSEGELRAMRGSVVAYVPQDPGTALNPALRIGTQLHECLRTHLPQLSRKERSERVRSCLAEVALPTDGAFLRRFPHQLSGGQQQRVAIAIAFSCRPKVIVCDEPTTGLDVTTQARVLETVRDLCKRHKVAALYVSHDLAVVSSLADRVAVMYAGRIVETGTRAEIFTAAKHPYTRGLLRALPQLLSRQPVQGIPGFAPSPGSRSAGCDFAARCPLTDTGCTSAVPSAEPLSQTHEVRCFHHDAEPLPEQPHPAVNAVAEDQPSDGLLRLEGLNAFYDGHQVLHDVTLQLRSGECLALVGESGSGKTTASRCIGGLHAEFKGTLEFEGRPLGVMSTRRTKQTRKDIQYIFQSPYASLNPRRTVGRTISRQIELFFDVSRAEAASRLRELLELVSLPVELAGCYPDQLSGGERQRVAIARALAAEPKLLVCDEVTSALDVSVQASIVETLRDLQSQTQVSLLFVTHNLALTRTIADRVAVMRDGRIVEHGTVTEVFDHPSSSYTRQLLRHTPTLESPTERVARLGDQTDAGQELTVST
ncbi:ABC transporter ATP-binding protein [Nocardioides mesophilus]|uniref:ABC transporter ATP-binding protein n=1 Tax=Nocardioides mesophilus TaxID=433659 RepID=A0A7G9R9T5_9ACTN|nr:ABC transporter ATP-binding protein [Nocardioides mesophilus]QNN52360.1 ABC transporter ATP-binding protein [Nocardioides mesophilus]